MCIVYDSQETAIRNLLQCVILLCFVSTVSDDELKKVAYPATDNRLGQTLSGTMTMGQTLDPKALANAAAATEALGAPPIGISFRLVSFHTLGMLG